MNFNQTDLQKAQHYGYLSSYYQNRNPALFDYYQRRHLHYLERSSSLPLRSESTGKMRILHALEDAKDVDVYVNEMRILKNFSYKDASDYLTLPAGTYQVDIYSSGDLTSAILSRKIALSSDKSYTVVPSGSGDTLKMLTFEDHPYVPHNESKLRFIHLVSDLPPLDIGVKDGDVIFDNLSFRKASDFLNIYPMKLDLEIKQAGTKEIIFTMPDMEFLAGMPLSIFIIGSANNTQAIDTLALIP